MVGRDRIVVEFTTTYVSAVYHHSCCEFESCSDEVYNIMGSICQWLSAGMLFSSGTPVFSTNEIDRHDITEILLKVALSTIIPLNLRMF